MWTISTKQSVSAYHLSRSGLAEPAWYISTPQLRELLVAHEPLINYAMQHGCELLSTVGGLSLGTCAG